MMRWGGVLLAIFLATHCPITFGSAFASVCAFLGCVLIIAADAQKYFTLRIKRGLITDGMYRFIRHPNYLGEMMTYGSFALIAWHWLPFIVLAWIWGGLFAVNMTLKEASMSRYAEWADYKKRSWWLVPG